MGDTHILCLRIELMQLLPDPEAKHEAMCGLRSYGNSCAYFKDS